MSASKRSRKGIRLRRQMISDQVKDYLSNAILEGKYPPGTRIVESALAEQLGVSQAPVREALRELVVLGFLESEPYKGATVRTFSEQELYEVYTVRAALEALAARQAAPRLGKQGIEKLRGLLNQMVVAAEEEQSDVMVRLDNEFHETIIKASGNGLLLKLWRSLQFGHWTLFTLLHSERDTAFLAQRHEPLLAALATGDPEQAAAAMREHIETLGPVVNPDVTNETGADDE